MHATTRQDLLKTCLVSLASKKYGTIADAESAFLLLAFLVDLRDCPGFDGVCLSLGGSRANEFCRIDVYGRCRAGRRIRNYDLRNRRGSSGCTGGIECLACGYSQSAQI